MQSKSIGRLILLIFISFQTMVTQGQADNKSILLTINKEAATIDELLFQMEKSIKADRHKKLLQQKTIFEKTLNAIETASLKLEKDMNESLSDIVNKYKTKLEAFGKLLHKGALFDKDKLLDESILELKRSQASLRDYLRNAYSKLIAEAEKQPVQTPQPGKEGPLPKTDTLKKVSPKQDPPKEILPKESNEEKSLPRQQTENMPEEPEVLDNILQAADEISSLEDSLHLAVKKSQYVKVQVMAKRILRNAMKIEDFGVLLKSDQKENIRRLASGLKNEAQSLHDLAHSKHPDHSRIHIQLEKIESKFAALSAGIKTLR